MLRLCKVSNISQYALQIVCQNSSQPRTGQRRLTRLFLFVGENEWFPLRMFAHKHLIDAGAIHIDNLKVETLPTERLARFGDMFE